MKLRFWIFSAFFVLHCLFINSVLAATIDEVRHMLSRTTFGGSWVDIQALSNMGYEAAVKHLLDQGRKQPQTPPPDWINQSPMQGKKRKQLSEAKRRALRKELRRRTMELKAWWFREMVQTDSPLTVQNDLHRSAQALSRKVNAGGPLKTEFPKTPIGRNFETAARLIASDTGIPVINVSHGGFDTHANQRVNHDRILGQLAEATAAFRLAMQETGWWDRVLVMTYSEFGRRPAENNSRGTDHGTAAPHFVLGGKVKGGIYGNQPSLADLEKGDLKFNIDFRRLYATVARNWWGLNNSFLGGGPYATLNFV
jgi:uncharacterized protein (DUF1501 family)